MRTNTNLSVNFFRFPFVRDLKHGYDMLKTLHGCRCRLVHCIQFRKALLEYFDTGREEQSRRQTVHSVGKHTFFKKNRQFDKKSMLKTDHGYYPDYFLISG